MLVNGLGRAEKLVPRGLAGRSLMIFIQSMQMKEKQKR